MLQNATPRGYVGFGIGASAGLSICYVVAWSSMPRPKEEIISDFLIGEVEKHKLLKRPCIVGFQGPQGSGAYAWAHDRQVVYVCAYR